MKNLSILGLYVALTACVACNSDTKSSTVTISTTIEQNDTTQKMVKKEVIVINEKVNGKEVSLKSENGKIAHLSIDGKEIPAADYEKHKDITEPILKKLPTPPTSPSVNTVVIEESDDNEMDKIIEGELKKDGFIKGETIKYDFDLSHDALVINGKTQSAEMKDRYLKLFKTQTGKELGQKFHIKLQEEKR